MSVDIAGGRPRINAKESSAIIRRELVVSHYRQSAISEPIIMNLITIIKIQSVSALIIFPYKLLYMQ